MKMGAEGTGAESPELGIMIIIISFPRGCSESETRLNRTNNSTMDSSHGAAVYANEWREHAESETGISAPGSGILGAAVYTNELSRSATKENL